MICYEYAQQTAVFVRIGSHWSVHVVVRNNTDVARCDVSINWCYASTHNFKKLKVDASASNN